MTILEQMRSEGDFTDTEKNIIQYILSDPSSLKEGTIGNIAQNTYSSNATIVRLCKKLGFQGIRDFRQAFLVELESKKYIVNSVDYTVPFETIAFCSFYIWVSRGYHGHVIAKSNEIHGSSLDGFRVFVFCLYDNMLSLKFFSFVFRIISFALYIHLNPISPIKAMSSL